MAKILACRAMWSGFDSRQEDTVTKQEYQAAYRAKNRERLRQYHRDRKFNLKLTVLDRYGKVCVQCGFDDHRALQIDHVNDNGAEERKSLGGQNFSGWRFYEWLIKNGLPDGYQTLCANCNNIKQWERNRNGG